MNSFKPIRQNRMNNPEELDWIEKIKAGDSSYFAPLYKHYHQRLYSLSYQFTRNTDDAEDQLQEIFLKILDKIDSFRNDASFYTWACRLSINHLTNFQNRKMNEYLELNEDATDLGSHDLSDNLGLAQILNRSIFELPEGFRKVFILYDHLGYRHDEIAKILEIKSSTSRSQLSRARLLLRDKLRIELDRAAP